MSNAGAPPPLRATARRSTGDPVARCAGDRRHQHRPHSPELHRRPEFGEQQSAKKRNGDGAAGDLTIVPPPGDIAGDSKAS